MKKSLFQSPPHLCWIKRPFGDSMTMVRTLIGTGSAGLLVKTMLKFLPFRFPLCSENYLLSLSQSFTLVVLDILTKELIGLSACGYTLHYKIQKVGSLL